MEKVFFKEEQQFRNGWLGYILLAMVIPVLFMCLNLFHAIHDHSGHILHKSFNCTLYFVALIIINWLYFKLKLIVEIRESGIWFRFPPLIRKWRTISKAEIHNYEVLQYKPIVEYGGWGIKKRLDKTAYNVSGNKGLQLYLKNGKRVLFGTQRTEAIKAAMDKLMK